MRQRCPPRGTNGARARARDGSRSRWGALTEQGKAGSGHGRRLPWPLTISGQCFRSSTLCKREASDRVDPSTTYRQPAV
jgi:hypothetical protein